VKNKPFLLLLYCFSAFCFAQQKGELKISKKDSTNFVKNTKYTVLSPAKAAFYSTVVPGLGQVYNKKYWKIPIIYAGMGTGIYFYNRNNVQYHRFRDAYKRRLAGYRDDEFIDPDTGVELLSMESLIDAQKFHSKNKELSIIVTAVFYILNIVDANVDAHLMNFNVDKNLTLAPDFRQNDFTQKPNLGLTLNYRF